MCIKEIGLVLNKWDYKKTIIERLIKLHQVHKAEWVWIRRLENLHVRFLGSWDLKKQNHNIQMRVRRAVKELKLEGIIKTKVVSTKIKGDTQKRKRLYLKYNK